MQGRVFGGQLVHRPPEPGIGLVQPGEPGLLVLGLAPLAVQLRGERRLRAPHFPHLLLRAVALPHHAAQLSRQALGSRRLRGELVLEPLRVLGGPPGFRGGGRPVGERLGDEGELLVGEHGRARHLDGLVRGDRDEVRVRHTGAHPPVVRRVLVQRVQVGARPVPDDQRTDRHVLPEHLDVLEGAREQVAEALLVELVHVERVLVAVVVGVDLDVRRAAQEDPARRQQPADQPQHEVLVLDVLDRLEARDDVERCFVRQRFRVLDGPDVEPQRLGAVAPGRVLDGDRVEFEPDHVGGRFTQQRGAVALATGEIQHPLARHVPQREGVPVVVLVDHLVVVGPRHAPLAGPLDQALTSAPRVHGEQVSGNDHGGGRPSVTYRP